jgi:hypothetical protein
VVSLWRPHHLDNDLVVIADIAIGARHRQSHCGRTRPIPPAPGRAMAGRSMMPLPVVASAGGLRY